MPVYRYNPAWLASYVPDASLTVRDQAILLDVAGRYALDAFDVGSGGGARRATVDRLVAGDVTAERRVVRVSAAETRAAYGVPSRRDLDQSLDRLRKATNRGLPVFDEIDVRGDVVHLTVAANGALLSAHHLLGQVAQGGRHHWYADLDVAKLAGMRCAASLPLACRLYVWLTSPSRVGLEGCTQVEAKAFVRETGTPGQLHATVPVREFESVFGSALDKPSIFDRAKPVMLQDLLRLSVTARWHWHRTGRTVTYLRLSAYGMDMDEYRADEEVPEAQALPRRSVLRGLRPAPVEVEPVVDVDPTPTEPVPTFRMRGALPGPVDLDDDAPDMSPERLAAFRDEQVPLLEDGSAHAELPACRDGTMADVEPAPVPIAPVPAVDAVAAPEPVEVAVEPASTDPEVDPDDDPNETYLKPGEIRPGVWLAPEMAKVTRVGEPPTERDLHIASPGRGTGRPRLTPHHRGCPPEDTPHLHHMVPYLWVDRRVTSGAIINFPYRGWLADGPDDLYDTSYEYDEVAKRDLFHVAVTPKSRLLNNINELFAYMAECETFKKSDPDLVAHDAELSGAPTD